ncbi:MAG: glycosyl transferase family 1 [Deltaproteobacteria bacterium GWA2_54_12]|nr:MAG: glycosyl transferase family 1 [Deltaproteobacteria bacterium GWA2_54_12]
MNKFYRADLHVHSKYSNKPDLWALVKLNCSESYTSPESLYKSARENGMDYVTITDHNTINGALEIAHLPGTFIGSEITTYFPEDGCSVHVVVLDITERIFKDILYLQKNIYELAGYLQYNGIAHFVAHAIYDLNERLKVQHIEKMLLLFEAFEVKNGARAKRYNCFLKEMLSSLTEEKIGFLSDKHNIKPYGHQPWKKAFVGGSDDHSGFFIGRAHTVSAEGKTIKDFIGSVKEKKTWAEGEDGDPLTLAHSIYKIGYGYFRERIHQKGRNSLPFLDVLMHRLFDEGPGKFSLFNKINFLIRKNLLQVFYGNEGQTFEEILDREVKELLNDADFLERIDAEKGHRKIFTLTSHLTNRMIYLYANSLLSKLSSMDIISLAQSLSTLGLVHLLASPYYVAFHHQHRSKALMKELGERFSLKDHFNETEKIALFTDTLHEINGVAFTIKKLTDTAKRQGIELVVITSTSDETSFEKGIMNFKSLGDVALPEYPEMRLHFPPVLDILDYFEKEGFTRIHASTPGSLGLLALFIAKLLDIPISSTYHTDIPRFTKSLTDDSFLENIAWDYMVWFYNQMEEVIVPSSSTERQLIEKGVHAEKTRPLPRWVDTEAFSPGKRNMHIWNRYGLNGDFKFLYVGRVSKEKNLELLADAFIDIVRSGLHSDLVIVGDGPYRDDLEKRLRGYPVLFTGFLLGDELSTIYASSDLFVFPSATDTFGNVILEAQASGLPVIVSDEGGPKEIVIDGETGFVIKANSRELLVHIMKLFLENREMAASMGKKAKSFVDAMGIDPDDAYSTILKSHAVATQP